MNWCSVLVSARHCGGSSQQNVAPGFCAYFLGATERRDQPAQWVTRDPVIELIKI